GGTALDTEWARADGSKALVKIQPRATPQAGEITTAEGKQAVEHLLGLVSVMRVQPGAAPGEPEPAQGLRPGDIFARLGNIEFPSVAEGIAEIHAHRGRQIEVDVLRDGPSGLEREKIDPDPTVHPKEKGQIGFLPGDVGTVSTMVALPPRSITDP